MRKRTVLVTGATGFVGSNVLQALMPTEDIHLVAACRDRSRLLPGFDGEVRQGDLTDGAYLRTVLDGIDVVCHAAAWTSLWAHERDERRYFRDPTIGLIDAAIDAGVERFIWDSSVAVVAPKRDGSPIGDGELGARTGFWPHIDMVVDIEEHMRRRSKRGTKMIVLRFGHFVGARYNLGLLSLLVPRLRTHLVPWVTGGRARQPLVAGPDIGAAYRLAAQADELKGFEVYNICGPSFPTMREVIGLLNEEFGIPRPHFGVPLGAAYVFGRSMEALNRLLPGDPFLTRAIVFLGEDRFAPSDLAKERLGYEPKIDWKTAVRRQLIDMEDRGRPPIPLADSIRSTTR